VGPPGIHKSPLADTCPQPASDELLAGEDGRTLVCMEDFLRAICREQGVFTRADALALGYDDRGIRARVRAGVWRRVRRGAFTFVDIWRALDERGRHSLLSRAVLRNARCEPALSHTSALMEFGTPYWDLALDEVHLTRFDEKGGRREAGVVQHYGAVVADDLTIRNGLLITSATRTALDLTTIHATEHCVLAIDGLMNAGETTIELVRRRYQAMTWWPYTLKTDLVLNLVDGRSESAGESRTRYLCWRQGLPAPVPQFEVFDGGVMVARLDLAWPELGVWLEFDGKAKYTKFLRDGESPSDAVLREKRREDTIRRITGWRCIRVTWADLFQPELLACRIRRIMREQAAA
jgi:hypothetical protein